MQVRDRAHLSGAQIIERLATIAPKTVRGRTRTPSLVRTHAKLAVDGPVSETWRLGYLIDTIYFRDLWMHRIDLAHALGQPVELRADHDGRIVADIVAEWSRRHGKPFVLELTGLAGGSYAHEPHLTDVETLTLDAVEFCRALSGRAHATGLLTTVVPF